MDKKKIVKLKIRKVNRFVYVKQPQPAGSLSDSTTVLTTTLAGFNN